LKVIHSCNLNVQVSKKVIDLGDPSLVLKCPEIDEISNRFKTEINVDHLGDEVIAYVPTAYHQRALEPYLESLSSLCGWPISEIRVNREIKKVKDQHQAELNFSNLREVSSENFDHKNFEKAQLPGHPAPSQNTSFSPLSSRAAPVFFPPRSSSPHFIQSTSNELSYELAKRWAQQVSYAQEAQFLWVHGPTSSGKTHLLKQLNSWIDPSKNLVFVNVVAFLNEWRVALESKQVLSFVQKYRKETDVLVIEHLDELKGKLKTQEEFLYTVNALIERGASVAVSSVMRPTEIKKEIDENLFGRLFSGVSIHMNESPCRDLKEKLLKTMLEDEGLSTDSIPFKVQENLLNLNFQSFGKAKTAYMNALIRLSVKSTLSMEDAQELEFKFAFKNSEQKLINSINGKTPRMILEEIAKLMCVSGSSILGASRRKEVSLARKFVCKFFSEHLGLSNSSIAFYIEKDPSTITYALKRFEKELKSDKHLLRQWNYMESQLGTE